MTRVPAARSLRLAVAGTPLLAVDALHALQRTRHTVDLLLTRPAAPSGRGRSAQPTPLARAGVALGIPVLAPERTDDPDLLARLRAQAIDLVVVIAYGAMIGSAARAAVPLGWINVHFSLLPAWRGAAPVTYAIWQGDALTGVTIFRIDAGLDTGDILDRTVVPIPPRATAGELLTVLAQVGNERLPEVIDGIAQGTCQAEPQPTGPVSHAPRLTVADAHIDFTADAGQVDRQVRAMTPRPGAWALIGDQRLRIGPVTLGAAAVGAPGTVTRISQAVEVACGQSAVRLGWVQPAGGRQMPAIDWWRGARIAADARLR